MSRRILYEQLARPALRPPPTARWREIVYGIQVVTGRDPAAMSASTAATMCRAEMPKRSSSSAGLPLRGTSRTARRRTPMPWGATASLTASPSPPAA